MPTKLATVPLVLQNEPPDPYQWIGPVSRACHRSASTRSAHDPHTISTRTMQIMFRCAWGRCGCFENAKPLVPKQCRSWCPYPPAVPERPGIDRAVEPALVVKDRLDLKPQFGHTKAPKARLSARSIEQRRHRGHSTLHCDDGVGGSERSEAGHNDVEVIVPGPAARGLGSPLSAPSRCWHRPTPRTTPLPSPPPEEMRFYVT